MADVEQVPRATHVSDFDLRTHIEASAFHLVAVTVDAELVSIGTIAVDDALVDFLIVGDEQGLTGQHPLDDFGGQRTGQRQVVVAAIEARPLD